jgi:hypothetical protein
MSKNEQMQRELMKRRLRIADRLAELKADADHWNRTHPDEEPIVIDVDLGPDIEKALRRATTPEGGSDDGR